jgi:hypothetical protein
MAAQKPPSGQRHPLEGAMDADGVERIFGTGRLEAAHRHEQRRDEGAIEADRAYD